MTARPATAPAADGPPAPDLVARARAMGVNVNRPDRATEAGLREAMRQAEEWRRENAEAIQSYNDWIEKNGLPLEEYRQF